ncbi:hypothetical protein HZS_7923 [Henneguya salminicola]|nr:hypothetical protein HZS_7923 [Henneguya salminicola]
MTFDIINTNDFSNMESKEPLAITFITGTQEEGEIVFVSASNIQPLHTTDTDDDQYFNSPTIVCNGFTQKGGVNRLRYCGLNSKELISTWSESGVVYIWDPCPYLERLKQTKRKEQISPNMETPLAIFNAHKCEGFALNWSKNIMGRLASGDKEGAIYVYSVENTDTPLKFKANDASVEDLQWSPTEDSILASCACDGFIRIWDIRISSNQSLMQTRASETELNVISWSTFDPFVISGDDNGMIKIWDMRTLSENCEYAAFFSFHTQPITSVEWHPSEFTVFAASGEDNIISLWDVSAERDPESTQEDQSLPPQLLFVNRDQAEIKELHWHPNYAGLVLSVAYDGFDIFKTINV